MQQYVFRRTETVVCPKPRRLSLLNPTVDHPIRWQSSHQAELCDSITSPDLLDIVLAKGGCGVEQYCSQVASSPPFLRGSPPGRVANPVIEDARFRDEEVSKPLHIVSSPARKVGRVRGNFGSNPMVRVEGFDCLDRGSRNCSITAIA